MSDHANEGVCILVLLARLTATHYAAISTSFSSRIAGYQRLIPAAVNVPWTYRVSFDSLRALLERSQICLTEQAYYIKLCSAAVNRTDLSNADVHYLRLFQYTRYEYIQSTNKLGWQTLTLAFSLCSVAYFPSRQNWQIKFRNIARITPKVGKAATRSLHRSKRCSALRVADSS